MNVVKSAGKQSKQAAKKIARQMAQEPLEVLKTAGSQVSGQEKSPPTSSEENEQKPQSKDGKTPPNEGNLKMQSQRYLDAHRKELGEIRKQETYEELQRRVAEGEDVPVENYGELSSEQKEVLKAQIEVMKKRAEEEGGDKPLIEPTGKRKRGVMAGMSGKIEKMKKRREIRMPPSG